MQQVGGVSSAASLVPWADRVRVMAWLRVAIAATLVLSYVLQPEIWTRPVGPLIAGTCTYALVSFALVFRLQTDPGRRRLFAFNVTLITDGLLLGWMVYSTQWMASPLRMLIILHVLVVTLGASYRTGFKIAMWHALVLTILTELVAVEILTDPDTLGGVQTRAAVSWFIGGVVLTVLVTAAASQVNERVLRRNRFDLNNLATMEAEFQRATSPIDTAEIAVKGVVATFSVHRVVLIRVQDSIARVLADHGTQDRPRVIQTSVLRTEDSPVLSTVARARETLLRARLGAPESDWLANLLPDARNIIVLPLVAENSFRGVLVAELLTARGGSIERQTVAMLTRFTRHISMALSHAWLAEALQDEAQRDGLTGLLNRRALDTRLTAELDRADRDRLPLSLMLMDIDHFKRLNDEHGHIAGDEVLKAVAKALERGRRVSDLVARYGGEEFVIVMPNTSRDEAERAAERLTTSLKQTPGPVPVTVSVGVATAEPGWRDPTGLIDAADGAMYQAKEAGRDRIVPAGQVLTP